MCSDKSCGKHPGGGKVYFLSDLHLGARYVGDTHAAERRVMRFLESIRYDAEEIFLVGDVLDYWYEYRYVVPRGFVRFFGKLAELSDAGVKITWLIGNHDIWIFDYLPAELGIEVVDGAVTRNIMGHGFFITHGDDIDDDSRSFRLMRSLFRNRVCQKLFAAVHPRWTVPFAFGWSKSNRLSDSRYGKTPDIRPFMEFARKYREQHPETDYFVFGHLHIEVQRQLPGGGEMVVLGDWIDKFTYAVYDGRSLTMHNWREQPEETHV